MARATWSGNRHTRRGPSGGNRRSGFARQTDSSDRTSNALLMLGTPHHNLELHILNSSLRMGRFMSRMAQIQALLEADPNDVMARYMLGMEHVSAGDDTSAVAVFRQIIKQEPYVPAYHMAGQALIRLGLTDEATEILRQGIAVARKTADEHTALEMEGLLATID